MNTPEPQTENLWPPTWPTVMDEVERRYGPSPVRLDLLQDMKDRHKIGIAKYGVPLQPFNGRKPLVDAYQEALDLVVYMRAALTEALTANDLQAKDIREWYHEAIYIAFKLRRVLTMRETNA